jgi:hypothetical protein
MANSASRGASKNLSAPQSNFGSGMLLTGFVLGVVATLGGQWLLRSGFGTEDRASQITDTVDVATDFEFYTLLGDIEVEVPEANVISAEDDDIIYWLQAASFRDPADAEEMRVTLLLNNMEAEVKPFSHEGTLWHRVIAGPFQTRTQMNKAKENLVGLGRTPITLRENLSQQ